MSHATVADSITKNIIEQLEKNRYKCWFAQRDVQAGEHYASALSRALATSAAVVLVLDENANKSKHVLREITIAIERSIPVFVIQFGAFSLSEGLDYLLSGIQRIHSKLDEVEVSSMLLVDQISKANVMAIYLNEDEDKVLHHPKPIIEVAPDEWDFASNLPLPNWLKNLFRDKK